MFGRLPRAILDCPYRGSQVPQWPFTLNTDSPQAQGLLGWWPNGPSIGTLSLYDLVGYNTISLTAGVTWSSYYEGDLGAYFGGSATYGGDASSSYLLNSSYSWSQWLIADAAPGTANVKQSIQNGSNSDSWGFSWNHTNSSFQQAAYHKQSSDQTYYSAKLTSTLSGNTKYLIVTTWDGSNLRVYLNGSLEPTTAVTSPVDASGNFRISRAGNGFNGTIFETRVYKITLSPAVIAQMWEPKTRWDMYYPLRQKTWSWASVSARGLFRQSQLSGLGAGGSFFQDPLLI